MTNPSSPTPPRDPVEEWAKNALAGIHRFLAELDALQNGVGGNYTLGYERLARWKERLIHWLGANISIEEADRLRKRQIVTGGLVHVAWFSNVQLHQSFLVTLRDEIRANSKYWFARAQTAARRKAAPRENPPASRGEVVFIGHGRNPLWTRVESHLKNDLSLQTLAFESEARAGEHIVEILTGFMERATFAVLVLTAEDETSAGELRARQNVVHEAGLFQGRLGFRKVVLLIQAGLEEFTNIAGLQQISFTGDAIEQTFYDLDRVLERERVIARRSTAA